ncbi:MAG: hypothetical protein ABH867_01005 [Patescibacteria group bacterium]|nr:hypothetical protein [Patescibacteria group bacterium]
MEEQTQKDDRYQKLSSIILNNDRFLVAADGSSFDAIAAASGLALMLRSLEKEVILYSPQAVRGESFGSLVGLEGFRQEIGGNSNKLLMTFDCPLDAIEKVSSNDEGEKLNLVVEFKEDVAAIDPSKVKISQAGPVFGAGFVINCRLPNEDQLVRKGQWVWLTQNGPNKPWAEVSLVEKKATFSESMASVLSRTNLGIPPEAAFNFYLGLKKGTADFSEADSIALETAAYCLRIKEDMEKGGVKQQKEVVGDQPPIDQIETKETKTLDDWQKPPIFTGATTPKV